MSTLPPPRPPHEGIPAAHLHVWHITLNEAIIVVQFFAGDCYSLLDCLKIIAQCIAGLQHPAFHSFGNRSYGGLKPSDGICIALTSLPLVF